MKTKDGFIQGYNAQAAVDATAQVIVAHGLDAKQSDQHQLAPSPTPSKPISARSRRNCRRTRAIAPTPTLRRWRNARSTPISRRGGPSTRGKEKAAAPASPPCAKIKAGGHSSPYRLRKQLPEPVFGQIKQARGFRQFLLRGVEKVANECGLVCLAHNILKLAQRRTPSLAALATR